MACRTEQREKTQELFEESPHESFMAHELTANGLKPDLAKTVVNGLCRTCWEGS